MSLSRDTLLLGIALLLFGTWIEVSGMGGWPFAVTGLSLAAIGWLGSIGSALRSVPETSLPDDPP
jgi:hypothetical protein